MAIFVIDFSIFSFLYESKQYAKDKYACKEVAKYSKSGFNILNKLKFMQTMTHPVDNVLSGLYKRDIKCKTTCVDRIAALLYPKLM